ncbi:hypothetical protein IAH82_002980 [Escherichia coli]|nr:hypothetical protein [Escherichia coli]
MTGKLVGALLLGLGLLAILLLAGVWKRPSRPSNHAPVRKYRLSHEYENKGFSEKGQSEGILDVPATTDKPDGHHHGQKTDSFQTTSSDTHPSTPGDNF